MSPYDLAARWERIRQLKRDGELVEAIALLEQEAKDQEAEHRRTGSGVAPAAFRELQKIYRREGRHSDEVAILGRWKAGARSPDARTDALIEEAKRRMEAAVAGPTPVACPQCGVVLDPPPKASRNCPECREKLVVRTDPVTREKLVLTPAAAKDFDRQKQAARGKRKVMDRLGHLGLGGADYDKAARDLREQFDVTEPQHGDVFWRLANSLYVRQEQTGQWLDAARTWSEMAEHLHDEGRDPNRALVGKFKNQLRYHADATAPGSPSTAIPFVDVVAHSGCEVCGMDDARRIAIPDAQAKMPLPHKDCSAGFCLCGYRSVYPPSAYDSDGNLTVARVQVDVDLDLPGPRKTNPFKRLFGG